MIYFCALCPCKRKMYAVVLLYFFDSLQEMHVGIMNIWHHLERIQNIYKNTRCMKCEWKRERENRNEKEKKTSLSELACGVTLNWFTIPTFFNFLHAAKWVFAFSFICWRKRRIKKRGMMMECWFYCSSSFSILRRW